MSSFALLKVIAQTLIVMHILLALETKKKQKF